MKTIYRTTIDEFNVIRKLEDLYKATMTIQDNSKTDESDDFYDEEQDTYVPLEEGVNYISELVENDRELFETKLDDHEKLVYYRLICDLDILGE